MKSEKTANTKRPLPDAHTQGVLPPDSGLWTEGYPPGRSLQLSRSLYKSALFAQNEPNFQRPGFPPISCPRKSYVESDQNRPMQNEPKRTQSRASPIRCPARPGPDRGKPGCTIKTRNSQLDTGHSGALSRAAVLRPDRPERLASSDTARPED